MLALFMMLTSDQTGETGFDDPAILCSLYNVLFLAGSAQAAIRLPDASWKA
jgi:hypothetical protein